MVSVGGGGSKNLNNFQKVHKSRFNIFTLCLEREMMNVTRLKRITKLQDHVDLRKKNIIVPGKLCSFTSWPIGEFQLWGIGMR